MVVPFQTSDTIQNHSNFTSRDRVKLVLPLILLSTDNGPATRTGQQRINARVPNWLRVVFYYAGTNDGPWESLPRNAEVSVTADPETEEILSADIEGAEAEYEQYRKVAVDWWKLTEAPLSPVRTAIRLPGLARKFSRDAVREAKDVVKEIRNIGSTEPAEPQIRSEEELEQIRRSSDMVGLSLRDDPKRREKFRESALQGGPMMADQVKGGTRQAADFELFLEMNQRYGVITEEEVTEWSRRAGLS